MDERVRVIARLLDGEKMAALCNEFGMSRKTGYKIYDRYSHDREKQIALEAWARRLRGILKGKPAKGDVVAFGRGA
jgi:hypothetical protein